MVIRSIYSIVGTLVMLAIFDAVLISYCVALLIPALLLNTFYGRRALRFGSGLHDQLEQEINIVERASPGEVAQHFRRVASWRIKLSDSEALTLGLMELLVLALMIAALIRFCSAPGVAAGDIFAVFRYVLMFVMGLGQCTADCSISQSLARYTATCVTVGRALFTNHASAQRVHENTIP